MRVHLLEPGDNRLREAVIELGDRHRKTLGHLPYQAFEEHADRGLIAVAVEDDQLLGYCLHALPRDIVRIVHLCVDENARGRGVARALVEWVAARHADRTRMVLRCRRDYAAHTLWPQLSFVPVGEVTGRSQARTKLTEWVRYLSPPPSLFDAQTEDDTLLVAMDTNVFLDLVEERPSPDVEPLRSPAIRKHAELLVTSAVSAEIDRHTDASARARARAGILDFRVARTPAEALTSAEQTLEDGLGRPVDASRDADDLRHLGAAIASGADVFITRDHNLRTRLGGVAERSGLSVLAPAQLIRRIDEDHQHGRYRPADLAATSLTRQRVAAADLDELVRRFLDHGAGETRGEFERHVRQVMVAPERWEFVVVRAEGRPIVLFAGSVGPDVRGQISVARCSNDALGRTALVHMVADYRREVASDPPTVLTVTDKLRPHVRSSLEAEGFDSSTGPPSAACGLGFHEPAELARAIDSACINGDDHAAIRLAERLHAAADRRTVVAAEKSVLPARFRHPDVTTYLVPIRPAFAQALFDEDLAAQTLFPREARLGLSRENVYYRSPTGPRFDTPSRIVWYVTGSHAPGVLGVGAARAVSNLISVHVGAPEQVHARFEHLGAYTRDQVERVGPRVQALRFTSTEAFRRPVPLARLRELADAEGHSLLLRSPWRLPTSLADRILATGV